MNNEKGQAKSFNEGKNMLDLISPFVEQEVGKVYTFGAGKYGRSNYQSGMAWNKTIGSILRHINAFRLGEDFDKESGLLHLAHAMVRTSFLIDYYKIYPQGDDRPHRYLLQNKIGLDIDEVLADFVGAIMKRFPDKVKQRSIYWNDATLHECLSQVKDDEDFWLSIEPTIKELPFEPHCYITSRSISPIITQKWLDMNGFPHAPLYALVSGQSKVEAAKESGCDVFVDDSYEHFVDLNRNGIFCYLFDAPHNRRYDVGFRRIKSLNELVDFNNIQNNNDEH